jgi:hypothetical protein
VTSTVDGEVAVARSADATGAGGGGGVGGGAGGGEVCIAGCGTASTKFPVITLAAAYHLPLAASLPQQTLSLMMLAPTAEEPPPKGTSEPFARMFPDLSIERTVPFLSTKVAALPTKTCLMVAMVLCLWLAVWEDRAVIFRSG